MLHRITRATAARHPLVLVAALSALCVAAPLRAQEGADDSSSSAAPESVEIDPYTGPPIFLKKVEPPPPPREIDSKVVKIDHPGSENPLFERRIVQFSDDSFRSDGVHKEFFSNGKPFVEGQYDMGRPTGKWTYYHENGAVAKEVEYVDGRPNGEVLIRDESGKVLNKRTYKDGLRHGAWVNYNLENEEPLLEQNYAEGKPEGLWRTWFKNGQLRQEISFKDGVRDGAAKEWTSSGQPRVEANFREGKQHGVTTVWRRGGEVLKQVYEDGKLMEQTRESADNGGA